MSLIKPGQPGADFRNEMLRSSILTTVINLRLVTDSPVSSELQLFNEQEKQKLLEALEIMKMVMKRAKEKGIIK